jgi:uncharacterized protein (TIGR03083 family)
VKTGADMSERDYLSAVTSDTRLMLDLVRNHPGQAVPTCPGWDIARLVGHTSRVHRMATLVVREQRTDRPAPTDTPPPPESADDLPTYVSTGLDELISVLVSVAPSSPAWNMAGEPAVASFWHRRMCHETFVHRADAELAAGRPVTSIETNLSIDGVDEFFMMFRSRVLPQHPSVSLGGSLHLHATDGPGEWMIHLENGHLTLEHGHAKGDAAVRGTAMDLLLAVWGRYSFFDSRFEQFGNQDVVRRLAAVGAF